MGTFWIIFIGLILFFALVVYGGYKNLKKKEDIRSVLHFITHLFEQKNELTWRFLQEGNSVPEDERLEARCLDRFEYLMCTLSNAPDEDDVYLHNPGDDFTKKVYPFLKEAFLAYKQEKNLYSAATMFFQKMESI